MKKLLIVLVLIVLWLLFRDDIALSFRTRSVERQDIVPGRRLEDL
ncbi:hypothetical protein Rctr85_034 [Virus Rctr85]|nr:hypothetical protein Rctr85_034 [Virus Rctr85]